MYVFSHRNLGNFLHLYKENLLRTERYSVHCTISRRVRKSNVSSILLLDARTSVSSKKILADLTPYDRNTYHHGYELNKIFNISLPAASHEELAEVTRYEPGIQGLLRVWRKLFLTRTPNDSELFEDTSSLSACDMFYEDLFPLKREKLYFNGFWIWKFNDAYQIKEPNIIHVWNQKIKQKFIFSDEVYLEYAPLIKHMQKCESVSVHLRRGDYVGTDFDVCTQGYYEAARSYIENKLYHPTYYIFSDDPSYAKGLFQHWGAVEFVDGHCGSDAWKDMFLMSQCRHHIIANSTFSFWSAYLGDEQNTTIVIVPKEYYRNVKGFCLTKNDWIRL